MKVSVNEVKSRFSDRLDRLAISQEAIIADRGEPVAELVPIRATAKKNRNKLFRSAKGEFAVPDDLGDPPKEIEDLFW